MLGRHERRRDALREGWDVVLKGKSAVKVGSEGSGDSYGVVGSEQNS